MIEKLIKRAQRATWNCNTKVRKGKMTAIEARAFVLQRLDNILRYMRENGINMVDLEWGDRGKIHNVFRYVGIFHKACEDSIIINENLRALEERANLPPNSAGLGCCMVCGRTLTDPKSVKAGIGPVCAGK